MTDEEKFLKRHFIDLARQAESRSMYTYSGFLGLPEQSVLFSAGKDLSFIGWSLYGGSEAAERQLAVFGSEKDFGYGPDYPIVIMEVKPSSEKYGEELSHRDYLGAILGLGIERELIGDIIIKGKCAWFYALESAADFLRENLTEIRHTTVRCRLIGKASDDHPEIPELKPKLQELKINIASERLDSIVAGFTGISRSHVTELFSTKRVFVNGKITENYSKGLKEGDILNVRGFGKAVYCGISGTSRKGRLYVILEKYV